ncbi:protein eyes shut homolog [Procambarus clarkii]|uniref:protein eyes shut homolog n=1 Tax=Procambarus clarkii TaxID=6728 RepID=UPI003742426C
MLTWDLGAGPRRIMTSEALDATLHTHSALIGRRGRGAWLVVDTQKNISADSQGYLSSLNTNSMLYIGGHPSWNMTHLPADMWRHQGFRGCVFDLRVAGTLEGPWTALRIAGGANVKECGQDECHRDSCANGGTCVGLGATIRCECPVGWKGPRCEAASHVCEGGGRCAPGASCLGGGSSGAPLTCLCQLGRTGPRCEKGVNITDPHFSGDGSFLSLRAKNLRRESEVVMSFRPTRLDGLLLLVLPRRPPGDFMALALVNGTLQFTYHLGWRAPGLVVVRSEGEVRLQEWQTVQVWRRGGDGALTFRGTTTRAASPSPTTLLDVHSELFLGGAPDLAVVPPAVAPPDSRVAFRGCVRQVVINGVEQDLRVPGGGVVRGAGITDCDGTACGSQVCLNGGTCTPVGDTFVCTCPQEYTGARCQLARACLDHLCVNGGRCVPSYVSDSGKKRRHTLLQVEGPPRGNTGEVQVDGIKRKEPVRRRGNLIRDGQSTMHKEKYSVGKGNVFREMHLILEDGDVASNKKSDGDQEKRIRREGGIFKLVDGKEDVAMGKNEDMKRRETEDVNTAYSPYNCLCPLGYFGVHCEAGGEVVSARFSGRSFAVVPEGPFGSPAPDTDSLALNFSTSATHGLLLWRGQVDVPGEDFLGVGVSGGRVKVVWHLGGGTLGHLTTSGSVRDGAWHSLLVSRTGAVVTVFLNGRPTKAAASGTYTQINDAQGLFVGGFPNDVSVAFGTEGHFQGAFVGCIRDLIVHQASSPIKFSTLQQGQDLQPCS